MSNLGIGRKNNHFSGCIISTLNYYEIVRDNNTQPNNTMHTLNTVSKLPMSTYIVVTGKTHTPGNTVEIFRGTINEAVSCAMESWPDANCDSVRDWLDVLTSDYGSVKFEAQ